MWEWRGQGRDEEEDEEKLPGDEKKYHGRESFLESSGEENKCQDSESEQCIDLIRSFVLSSLNCLALRSN